MLTVRNMDTKIAVKLIFAERNSMQNSLEGKFQAECSIRFMYQQKLLIDVNGIYFCMF